MSAPCPSCGHADQRATRFCTRCGAALPVPGAAPVPAQQLPTLRPPRRAGGLTSLVAMFTGLAVVSGLLTYWVMAGS